MEQNKQNIIERNTEEGAFKLGQALLELEARYKNVLAILDEIKEVLQGQAGWSKQVDERLNRIDPKIILSTDKEYTETIDKLNGK